MADRHLEEEIRRTIVEVGRACRALVGRCRAVQKLARDAKQLGPLSRCAAKVGQQLEAVLTTISQTSGGKVTLDPVAGDKPHPSERVVKRCVNNVMGRLAAPAAVAPGTPSAPRATDEPTSERPALQGDNRLVSIPQVLEFLGWLERTGTLEVESLVESFTIALEDGVVVHAESDSSPNGQLLGDVLVAQAAISPAALAGVLDSIAAGEKRLGAALVESGKITRQQLERALEAQIRQLFVRLFDAQSATYAFYDATPDHIAHHVRLKTPILLLESAAQADAPVVPVAEPTADAA